MREYDQRDYVKQQRQEFEKTENRIAYLKDYWKKRWASEQGKNYSKNYERSPKRRLKKKEYYSRPEIREKYKNRRLHDLKYKEYQRNYAKSPKMKQWFKGYRKLDKYKINKLLYFKQRYNSESDFKIKNLLRNRTYCAFRNYSDTGKIMSSKKYGIDYDKIIKKLLTTLPNDFNEKKYHIDHIIPLCKFDFNDKEQIKLAFSPDNIQWLLAIENLKKGGRVY